MENFINAVYSSELKLTCVYDSKLDWYNLDCEKVNTLRDFIVYLENDCGYTVNIVNFDHWTIKKNDFSAIVWINC